MLLAVVVLLVLGAGAIGAALSTDLQEMLRRCPFCEHVNCIEIGSWWSCCNMALQGSCLSLEPPANASAPIWATCNISGAAAPYRASCSPALDDACAFPADAGGTQLGQLCALICSGCGA